MKKLTLLASAAMGLLSTSAVMAQTNVTLYGLVDAGYFSASGLRSGTYKGIASGIMEGSKFGMRGTEDIGGGYKGIFTLEGRFEADTGSLSNRPPSGGQLPDRFVSSDLLIPTFSPAQRAGLQPFFNTIAYGNAAGTIGTAGGVSAGVGVNVNPQALFDRQAFVGLVTPFGQFTAGRQYTPGYLVGASFDASQTQSSLAAGQVGSFPPTFDIRLSNTIQYGIKLDGLTAALMYGAGETGTSNANGRFYGGMAIYKGDGFSVGYGHNEKKNSVGQDSLTNNVFGATLDAGPGTVYGQYATIRDKNPEILALITPGITAAAVPLALAGTTPAAIIAAYSNALQLDARLMHVGYRMTTGPNTWVVAYSRLDDKRSNDADTSSYGVTYTYALSKRTNLNAVLVRFNNSGTGQAAPGGNGFLGGVTSTAGTDSTNIAFGIRHVF
ncbi:MAG: porin [Polaromonas sp.]|nr:porin [Polaromonas sp.]